MTQEPMVCYRDYLPHCEVPFYALTRHGIRQVVALSYIGYKYLDCTHPMQNNWCDPFDIIEWQYCDDRFIEHFPPIKNTVTKQIEADFILSTVRKPSVSDRIRFFTQRLIKHAKRLKWT